MKLDKHLDDCAAQDYIWFNLNCGNSKQRRLFTLNINNNKNTPSEISQVEFGVFIYALNINK